MASQDTVWAELTTTCGSEAGHGTEQSGSGTNRLPQQGNKRRQRRWSRFARALGLAALLALAGESRGQVAPLITPGSGGGVGLRGSQSIAPRQTGGAAALGQVQELQRRGEYEQAALRLKDMETAKATLSAGEQQELGRLLQVNRNALLNRQQARDLLSIAEKAWKDNQAERGREALRRLASVEQTLPVADRRRLDSVKAGLGVANKPAPLVGADSGSMMQARSRVAQARGMFVNGDLDGAEKLAREAASLSNDFAPGEDQPAKLLDDISRTRRDPKAMLSAARGALESGNFERAELLATAAEQNATVFTFPVWGDTPAKVKREAQAARSKLPTAVVNKPVEKPATSVVGQKAVSIKDSAVTQVSAKTTTVSRPSTNVADTEAARGLLEQGRKALKDGKLELAGQFADAAEGKRPALNYWEDNPELLKRDIRREQTRRGNGTTEAAVKVPTAPAPAPRELAPTVVDNSPYKVPRSQAEAEALIAEGRSLLAQGKIDEASAAARSAAGYRGRYGLFDDTPDHLASDVKKAREARDKAESAQVLKDARRALEAGDLDQATKLAYRAQQLHGAYYLWDLGDRPSKVLSEVQVARAKNPQPSKTAVASVPTLTPAPSTTGIMPVSTNNAAKLKVVELMAQAQQMQREGKLVEARQKLTEAQNLRVPFSSEEASPEQMQLQLATLVRQRVDRMVQQASEVASFGKAEPKANYELAEKQLLTARSLANDFGQDVSQVDAKLQWVAQMKTRLPGTTTTAALPPTPALPSTPMETGVARATDMAAVPTGVAPRGLELLELSRLELRKGQTILARKLAEEAIQGNFGVKELAMRRLREIDIEENNQRRLEAGRAFDAGVAAFNRGDLFQAKAILTSLTAGQLDVNRQARFREIMATPQMGTGTQLAATPTTPQASPVTRVQAVAPVNDGSARASDKPSGTGDLLVETRAMQNVQFQELREKSLQVRRDANDRFRNGDMEGAVEILEDYLTRLPEGQLDAERVSLLRRPIESLKQKYKVLKAQADLDSQTTSARQTAKDKVTKDVLADQTKQKKVADLLEKFNKSYREGKYKEAQQFAALAKELAPDNPVATTAALMSRTMIRREEYKAIKGEQEEFNLKTLNDADRIGPAATMSDPMKFDPKTWDRARQRKVATSVEIGTKKSQAAKEIDSKLNLPVNLNFSDAPLRQVIEDLRQQQGINIHPDYEALRQEGISLERPVSAKLEHISLKSALNLILSQAQITWVVRDEVLLITTKENARGKLVLKQYQVGDLVMEIPNYTTPASMDFNAQMANLQRPGVVTPQQQTSPTNPPASMPGMPAGAPSSPGSMASNNSQFGTANSGNNWMSSKSGAPLNSQQQQLINLIMNTIEPSSWSQNGGPGTIDYHPMTLTMIINQTLDIQEQIQDLLAALRRLQDQEVAIELRLITVADAFFERLGLDLDIKLKTDSMTERFEPQLTTGQFKPEPFVNDFSPSRLIAGITPAGTFTSDLDIPINPTSFARAIPPFGGFPNMPGADGGISLGVAFLSDIQVFLFMEAAQGDQRTNVMQAPRLTMFNGQSASLSVTNQQFFVTQVQALQAGGQLSYLPTNTNFATGVQINLQPVITGDRRFVRINFGNIQITNLASAIVPLFPIVSTIQPFFEGVGAVGNPILFTQFIQQPVFSSVLVQTTVVVPDGGTVLLGGLKRLSEGRNEFGPPVLSKIPYVNRLFKNVGYGRETESILLMVTPRIIINEEEEIIQTGVISNPQLVQ